MMKKKLLQYLFVTLGTLLCVILLFSRKEEADVIAVRDWEAIKEEGVLRAVTEYNGISYHVVEDSVTGFDLELLRAFAKDVGVKLEVYPEMSFDKRLDGVCRGMYDILATGTAVNVSLKDSLLFSTPLILGKQVLVQRKPSGKEDSTFVRNQLDLAEKTVWVVKNAPALLRLHHLMNEIADTIYIRQDSHYGPEQLMAMVAEGDIDYAVCDQNIAAKAIGQFTNLDMRTAIGFTQFYAWAVNRQAPQLLEQLNEWMARYRKTKAYEALVNRYFKS